MPPPTFPAPAAPAPFAPSTLPTPITAALRDRLEQAGRAVPADRRGRFDVAVSTKGVEGEIGIRFKRDWTVSGWGAYERGRGGAIGARFSGTW